MNRINLTRSKVVSALAVTAALILTTAILWGSWTGGEHSDFWGIAIPGTLTGIGTLALAAATYAVLRGDQRDRRDRDERELSDQAVRLHPGDPHLVDDGEVGWRVVVANRSDFPVRNVELFVIFGVDLLRTLKPDIAEHVFVRHERRQIPAGKEEEFTIAQSEWFGTARIEPYRLRDALVGNPDLTPLVAVAYVDASGTSWLRDPWWNLYKLRQALGRNDLAGMISMRAGSMYSWEEDLQIPMEVAQRITPR